MIMTWILQIWITMHCRYNTTHWIIQWKTVARTAVWQISRQGVVLDATTRGAPTTHEPSLCECGSLQLLSHHTHTHTSVMYLHKSLRPSDNSCRSDLFTFSFKHKQSENITDWGKRISERCLLLRTFATLFQSSCFLGHCRCLMIEITVARETL